MRDIAVHPLRPSETELVARLLDRIGEFTPEEVACAQEVIDEAVSKGNSEEEYRVLCAEAPEEGIVGFICYGRAPLTRATYDIYWIATDPAHRGMGVGRSLLAECETSLKRRGASLILVETSSLPSYALARGFYVEMGFYEESRIRDFYFPGNDKVVYCKRLSKE